MMTNPQCWTDAAHDATRRRTLIAGGLGLLATRIPVWAQARGRQVRIGFLSWGPPISAASAFVDEMRILGYVEGQNLTIDYRWTVAFERLPEQAVALVQSPLDAIVVVSTPAALAAKAATRTIPVIMATSADPVGGGVVESLARPGGNVTGLALMNPDLTAKRIELLKLAFPHLTSLAAIHRGPSDFPIIANWLKENTDTARRIGISLHDAPLAIDPADWEQSIASIPKRPGTGLTVLEDPTVVANSAKFSELVLKHHLPAVFPFREHVEAGGLLSYGVNLAQLFRSAARYLNRILHGAKPSELPIEQPTKFELIINLQTAKALGLTIPQSLLLRADEVIH